MKVQKVSGQDIGPIAGPLLALPQVVGVHECLPLQHQEEQQQQDLQQHHHHHQQQQQQHLAQLHHEQVALREKDDQLDRLDL